MGSIRDIEEAIRSRFDVTAGPALHDRVLAQVRRARERSEATPALREPVIGRTIMRSSITKLAAAAVVAIVVALGLLEFFGTGARSGTAWARVARKVQDMDTYTFRERRILTAGPRPEGFGFTADMESIYHCSKEHGVYVQSYRNGQPFVAFYGLPQSREQVIVDLSSKHYERKPMTDADITEIRDLQPQALVPRVLSRKHAEIGQDRIDGAAVLGVQTDDPAAYFRTVPAVEDFAARLWIDSQTDLPVWVEVSYVSKDSKMRTVLVYDRFRWNVDLAPSLFEPNIPPEFEPMQNGRPAEVGSSWETALQKYAKSAPYLSDFDHLPRPDMDHVVFLGVIAQPSPAGALPQEMEQAWRTQDGFIRGQPTYASVRDRLYQELVGMLHIDRLSVEELAATGIALRERFWAVGGDFSAVSYPYGYAARVVFEMAHEREPQNLAITDQLVESILTMELTWHYEPNSDKVSKNPVYAGPLLDLRARQYEQIQAQVSAGAVPTLKDLVRVCDLSMLLGMAGEFASAQQVFEWMVGQVERAGWTMYERRMKAGQKRSNEGHIYAFGVFVGGTAYPEEFRYGRRLSSFQGPQNRRQRLLPVHLADPRDVFFSGD
jgi:hypothetical protein